MLRLKKSGQENEIPGLGRPSLTHMYGSSPDEYMMYLLKQDMGEAESTLPVLDLFRYDCHYVAPPFIMRGGGNEI